jgi:HEAT repeat protein
VLAVLAAATALVLLSQDPAPPTRDWIEALAADDPAVRESASLGLRRAGRAAWPALDQAARTHPDPETRARASDLLETSRLRRRLSFRILDEHPGALLTLRAGATAEKLRLIRTLGRHFEEASDLLAEFSRDPEPEIAVAAAEVLYENRNTDWAGLLLRLYALEDCPRAGRIYELLCSASSRVSGEDLRQAFALAGPRARNRLLHLALSANLPLDVPPETIRAMLREGEAATRRGALAWIRDRGPGGNLLEIEPLLDAPDSPVAAEALATLRGLRHRPDPRVLGRLLGHPDALVREEAVHATAAFPEDAPISALVPLLGDPSTSVRQSALTALSKLQGARALETVLAAFLADAGDTREQAAGILAVSTPAVREWTLPRARALAADPDPERRWRGYDLLARMEGTPALFPLARDADPTVRRWALGKILQRTELPASVDAVEAFARDASVPVRFEALRALVRLGRRDHVPALQEFLSSPEYALKYDAAETLLEQGGDRATALARKLVEEEDAPLRRLALTSLAERGDRDHAARALEHLSDSDGRLRRASAQYLGRVLSTGKEPALLGRLAGSLAEAEGESLSLAFRLVVEHGDSGQASAVRDLVRSGRAPSPERAVRALAEWSGERAAADLLGLLGSDPSLNETVFTRLRDPVRRAPPEGRRDVEAALRALLSNPDRRVRRGALAAAEEMGLAGDAIPGLADDPEPSVRHAALGACARASLPAAARVLERRLDDEDPEVRILAVSSLAKLRPEAAQAAAAREDCAWAKRRMEPALKR